MITKGEREHEIFSNSDAASAGSPMSKRTQELAKQFAQGELPEQDHSPRHRWCNKCRTSNGKERGINMTKKCPSCKGSGVVSRG